jgi:hypothetical protein
MKKLLVSLVFACMVAPAFAADEKTADAILKSLVDIRLPRTPPVQVSPGIPAKLTPGVMYAFDGNTPYLPLVSPQGAVTITSEAGPMKIHGVFTDAKSPGVSETRTYKGKYVTIIHAKATGLCELMVVPQTGFVTDKDKNVTVDQKPILRAMIDVRMNPAPPTPTPVPPTPPTPVPVPTPDPAPIPVAGYRVLMVYDKANPTAVTKGQFDAIYGQSVRDFLEKNCVKVGNVAEYKIWPNTVDVSVLPDVWKQAMTQVDTKQMPYMIVSNGTTGWKGKIPESSTDMLTILNKYLPK